MPAKMGISFCASEIKNPLQWEAAAGSICDFNQMII